MNLDNDTCLKVSNILNTKYSHIEYVGCWSKDSLSFMLTNKWNNDIISGIYIDITNDFKLIRVRRITKIISRNIYGGIKNSGYKKVFDHINIPFN